MQSVTKAMDALEIDKLQGDLMSEPPTESAGALRKDLLVRRGKYAILVSKKSHFTRLRSATHGVLAVVVEPYFGSSHRPPHSAATTTSFDLGDHHHQQEDGVRNFVGTEDDAASDSAEEGDSDHDGSNVHSG